MANFNALLSPYAGLIALLVAVLALVVSGVAAWLAVRMRRLERHYTALTTGTDGRNLQNLLERHMQELRAAVCQVRDLDLQTHALASAARGHVQHLGVLRFNPFRETGGDQSFVIALADGEGNGAVISSLHSRDVTRVYAKPLTAWASPYPLTDEEQEGIRRARGQ